MYKFTVWCFQFLYGKLYFSSFSFKDWFTLTDFVEIAQQVVLVFSIIDISDLDFHNRQMDQRLRCCSCKKLFDIYLICSTLPKLLILSWNGIHLVTIFKKKQPVQNKFLSISCIELYSALATDLWITVYIILYLD